MGAIPSGKMPRADRFVGRSEQGLVAMSALEPASLPSYGSRPRREGITTTLSCSILAGKMPRQRSLRYRYENEKEP